MSQPVPRCIVSSDLQEEFALRRHLPRCHISPAHSDLLPRGRGRSLSVRKRGEPGWRCTIDIRPCRYFAWPCTPCQVPGGTGVVFPAHRRLSKVRITHRRRASRVDLRLPLPYSSLLFGILSGDTLRKRRDLQWTYVSFVHSAPGLQQVQWQSTNIAPEMRRLICGLMQTTW